MYFKGNSSLVGVFLLPFVDTHIQYIRAYYSSAISNLQELVSKQIDSERSYQIPKVSFILVTCKCG